MLPQHSASVTLLQAIGVSITAYKARRNSPQPPGLTLLGRTRALCRVLDALAMSMDESAHELGRARMTVVIHRQDGRIRARDPYGNDPCPPEDSK